MEFTTPRILSSQLNAHQGATVRLVGTVLKLVNNTLILQATDHGQVTVHITQPPVYNVNEVIEVVGKVQNGEIIENTSYIIGVGLDFECYNQAIARFCKAPHLFA